MESGLSNTSKSTNPPSNAQNSKGCQILRCLRQQFAVVSVFTLGIVTGIGIVTTIILFRGSPIKFNVVSQDTNSTAEENLNPSWEPLPETSTLGSKANFSLPGKLKLISRLEWLAQPPVEPANPLQIPVPYVIIHHTGTDNCSSEVQCISQVRYIQTFHIESRNWLDIGYNFLVGGNGEAYEGRGWKSEGAHMYGYNAKSIGIAFIGTFNSLKPPQRQITACKQLIAKGLELGYISKDYKLLAARQLQTTPNPGAALYEEMKTWDHWAEGP